ncbi:MULTISPECIES: hypothetical protein [Sphingobium]|uniref:Transporter n=1 Tax=Sphingobium soli TaxID=1591116 RepID=A0ABS8H532_9SPHN|nr:MULTISPECIES: hypothetical protein [Sphingobium]MCC4233640.1 hypothetical protein [Sphingobium soli]|tara:strand:+ start:411 stop:683 length:273 start_codon:yes stop_codon:yes gene_type:complete
MSAFRPAILAGLLPAALLTAPAGAAGHKAENQKPSRPQPLQTSQTNGDFFVHTVSAAVAIDTPMITLGQGIRFDAALFGPHLQLDKDLGQ